MTFILQIFYVQIISDAVIYFQDMVCLSISVCNLYCMLNGTWAYEQKRMHSLLTFIREIARMSIKHMRMRFWFTSISRKRVITIRFNAYSETWKNSGLLHTILFSNAIILCSIKWHISIEKLECKNTFFMD